MRWVLALVAVLGGCIQADTSHCGTLTCPADKVCDPHRVTCVLPGQIDVCAAANDGTPCEFPGEDDGVCDHGVCFTSECGDGLIGGLEVCDDANAIDGDGCSAGCLSNENCGNSIVDVAVGESCDDGNLESGDGCSSGCTAEVASWHEVDLDPYPGAFAAEAVYDAARDRIVMFGGDSPTGQAVRETWDYDGRQWQRLLQGELPPGRDSHVLVYDAARRASVVFGGANGTTLLGDTWIYDGAWHSLTTTGAPSARAGAAGAYDAATGKVVVFGGQTASGMSSETWELSGTTWTLLAAAGPEARRDHRMAYDSKRQRIVMFGGKSSAGNLDDTWEWTGAAWQQVTTATTIPAARGAIAYDAARGVTVLFSGGDALDATTWEFSGTDWAQVATTVAPGARRRAAMAYDPVLRAIVLRGGTARLPMQGGPPFDDTWRYDGSWVQDTAAEPHAPPARNYAGFAYDFARQRFVLAAGSTPGVGRRGDTWTYDGAQWVQQGDEPGLTLCGPVGECANRMVWDPVGERMLLVRPAMMGMETWSYDGRSWTKLVTSGTPPGRDLFVMAYDTKRHKVVLFGGAQMMMSANDTWELDGTTWTRKMTAVSPPGRSDAAMAYDAARGAMVLVGGRDGMTSLGDTWLYDGTAWTKLDTPHAPSPRMGSGIAFHTARGRVILFGGEGMMGPVNDTWELGPDDWTQLNVFEGPSPRKSPHLAYDPARKLVVLYGGDPAGDTWELLYRSTLGDEVCELQGDEDADGLSECGDPDCDDAFCGELDHACRAGACVCSGTLELCDNGLDDNCDGTTDCADAACAMTPLCKAETSCTNAADDDDDGRADCADPGCAGMGPCERTETRCTDAIDNDGDGLADCRDPDCFLSGCTEVLP